MISDDDLAVQARTDDRAFAMLALRYQGMVRGVARLHYAPGLDRDDLDQAALVGLWGAVRNFKPERGRFGPLADTAVRRSVYTAVKTARRMKHNVLSDAWRVTTNEDGEEQDAVELASRNRDDPVEVLIAREHFAAVIRIVTSDLSDLERGVAVGQMDGETYVETAQRLGLSHSPIGSTVRSKPVDNALARVKAKVGRALRNAA